MKDNIVGGPSIVFSRYQEKDVTKIRGVEYGEAAKTCKALKEINFQKSGEPVQKTGTVFV